MPKKSTKEVIEESTRKNPSIEHGYVHFPFQETVNVTKNSDARKVSYDKQKLKELRLKYEQTGTKIHTHPGGYIIPSNKDMSNFMVSPQRKYKRMVIAQTNKDTGEVEGYFILGKTKRTPDLSLANFLRIARSLHLYKKDRAPEADLEGISKQYHLNQKRIPARGFVYASSRGGFVPENSLEAKYEKLNPEQKRAYHKHMFEALAGHDQKRSKAMETLGVAGLILGLFFLSPNFTGNVIGTLAVSYSNLLGVVFIVAGLIGCFFWVRKRKNNRGL